MTIDEQSERKFLTIKALAAPGQVRACAELDLVGPPARHWSRFGGGPHAEAFEVIRETRAHQYLG